MYSVVLSGVLGRLWVSFTCTLFLTLNGKVPTCSLLVEGTTQWLDMHVCLSVCMYVARAQIKINSPRIISGQVGIGSPASTAAQPANPS